MLLFCSSGSCVCNGCPPCRTLASHVLRPRELSSGERNASAPTITSSKRPPERNSYSEGMEAVWHYSLIKSAAALSRLQRAGLESGCWCHFPKHWKAFHSCFWCMAGRGPWQHSRQNLNLPSRHLPIRRTFWYFWNFSKIQSPNYLSLKSIARCTLFHHDLEQWI